MAEDSLKRLLDAETKAEQIIADAESKRQQIVEAAYNEIAAAEQQHTARIKEINAATLSQAGQRAQQTIAEMKRRYAEQAATLRNAASSRENQALDIAITLLTSGNVTST